MSPPRPSQPFPRIATRYRLVNRFISFGLDGVWRTQAIRSLELSEGMTVFDLGCGPGEMLELTPKRVKRIGLDPAREMLYCSIAPFHRIVGMGEAIPVKALSADRVMSAFVLRNLTDRPATFSELARILKPNGVGAIMDFSPPEKNLWGLLATLFVRYGIPGIGGLLAGDVKAYQYLSRTILQFPPPAQIAEELADAGFIDIKCHRLVGGVNVLYNFRKING